MWHEFLTAIDELIARATSTPVIDAWQDRKGKLNARTQWF